MIHALMGLVSMILQPLATLAGGYMDTLLDRASRPETARMLRLFAFVFLFNGRWLMLRLQRHLEGRRRRRRK